MFAQRLSIACLTLSLSAACGMPEDAVEGDTVAHRVDELKRAAPAPTYALKTTKSYVAGVAPSFQTSFPIYSTYTLFVATEITGALSGHHLESVYLVAPNGAVYQRLDTSFATDVVAAAGEQQAEKTATGWRVWVSIPVAGTTIQQLKMVGNWSSEAWVDAANVATAKGSFSLN